MARWRLAASLVKSRNVEAEVSLDYLATGLLNAPLAP
jgi:hypothetical protein